MMGYGNFENRINFSDFQDNLCRFNRIHFRLTRKDCPISAFDVGMPKVQTFMQMSKKTNHSLHLTNF